MTNPDREELVKLLCEFFLDGFSEDAISVGDWLAQSGHDTDVVVPAVKLLFEAGTVKGEPEPVAWQYRYRPRGSVEWSDWGDCGPGNRAPKMRTNAYEIEERPLFLAPSADAGMREALEDIEALGRHLRHGGPDPMDLQELSDALSDAVDFASGALLVAASQPAIVTCCVTGAIPGDGGACGDCDPCIFGEASVPSPVKTLIAEKNSLLHRVGELEDKLAEALTAPGATTKSAEGFLSSLPSGESEPVVMQAWPSAGTVSKLATQVLALPRRVELIGGQRHSYVLLDNVIALIEAIEAQTSDGDVEGHVATPMTDKLKDETSERYAKGWNNALIAVCAAIRSGGGK